MRTNSGRIIVLAAAFAFLTWWLGWWTVPLLAGGWGVLARRRRGAVLLAALAAALGWAILLAWTTAHGPIGELARRLGALMGLPPAILVMLTLAFPALLAGSAARVGRGVREWGNEEIGNW